MVLPRDVVTRAFAEVGWHWGGDWCTPDHRRFSANGRRKLLRRPVRSSGMAHERMFDDDDSALRRVRDLAAAFPGSAEKVSHGRPAFFTKKVFAYYGGSLKVDGEWVQHPQSLVVLPDPDDHPALVADERVYVPAYLGPSGWVGFELDDRTGWDEVTELLDASYRLTAPQKLIDELDDH